MVGQFVATELDFDAWPTLEILSTNDHEYFRMVEILSKSRDFFGKIDFENVGQDPTRRVMRPSYGQDLAR